MAEVQMVIFKLMNEVYGIDIAQVHEVIRFQEVNKVPELPDFIEGIVNLRNKVLPVIDLNKKFKLCSKEVNDNTKIIVTSINGQHIGFKVDDVDEVMRFSDDQIESATHMFQAMGAKSYIKGIAKNEEQLITILDFNKILDQKEMMEIEQGNIG